MSVEREMSLAEWCAKLPSQHVVNRELATLTKQLAALAEQNEKMRKVLLRLACLGNGDQYGNSIGNCIAQEALSLPDLASPVLNLIRAETLTHFKVELEELVRWGDASISEVCVAINALEARVDKLTNNRAAELEKTNG